MICSACGKDFEPSYRHRKVCSDECKAVNAKKQNEIQVAKKKKQSLAKERTAKKETCKICKKKFIPKKSDQITCLSKECQEARVRVSIKEKRKKDKTRKFRDREYVRIEVDQDIENFEYSKLLRQREAVIRARISGRRSEMSQQVVEEARRRAIVEINDEILTMGQSERKDLLKLEKEYIREKEKEELRLNIQLVLNNLNQNGNYTLEEAGMVLGISKERTRQIQDSLVKSRGGGQVSRMGKLQRPDVVRKLRQYLSKREY